MPIDLKPYRKINGNVLKIIACITMLIDHIGAAIIIPVNQAGLIPDHETFEKIKTIYKACRWIGRSAFPIFCFLLVEGFIHTKSRLRYALSLLCFALLSELPYDYAFDTGSDQCNVMWTLFIAFITLWGTDFIKKFVEEHKLPTVAYYMFSGILMIPAILLAEYIHCDYRGYGIALVIIFYFLRPFDLVNLIAGFLFISLMPNEAHAFPAFILMAFYSGLQGRKLGNLKYIFYAYYPVHLTVLYLIRYALCN